MAALRSIRSNIEIERRKLEERSTDPEYEEYKREVTEDLRIRGIHPNNPDFLEHVKAIEKRPKYDAFLLMQASRAHRRALLKHAMRRINAYIHEAEQEVILDLITEAKTELHGNAIQNQ